MLLTAALFLQMLQQVFLGETPEHLGGFPELENAEVVPLVLLLLPVVVIGVAPAFLVDPMSATADALAAVLS